MIPAMHRIFRLVALMIIPLLTAYSQDPPPMPQIILRIGQSRYHVQLADTAAARELVQQLPITLAMTDLNANEKYGDLPQPLPTASRSIGHIHTGDLMLFTPTCLVLFYKDFRTSYHYTPVGRVLQADSLPATLGRGDVSITLEAP